MPERVYLDWNGAAPLSVEARAAMLAAMDIVGNPSSVHAGGREAKMIIDQARADVANLVGCEHDEVFFTSGATEATNWALRRGAWTSIFIAPIEHDAVMMAAEHSNANLLSVSVSRDGRIDRRTLADFMRAKADTRSLLCIQAANSETGVIQDVAALSSAAAAYDIKVFVDAAQGVGKHGEAGETFNFAKSGATFAAIASEKFGGPAGVGALVIRSGEALPPLIVGGGQEMRRRSGTENLVGIAGMGAAARAALERENIEDMVEITTSCRSTLSTLAPDFIDIGAGAARLANTINFAVPGWRGATQMMQMDLAGFAISAGSACSSGKVSESRVIRAMGYDRATAASSIRVSIGHTTREDEVAAFIDAWGTLYRQRNQKSRSA